jgi:hypothetical protein
VKPLRWIVLLCCVLPVMAAAADSDSKDVKDQIQGKWQGAKGAFTAKDALTFKKYEAFPAGTAGDYSITQLRGDLTGPGGKKLPPTEITVGTGSYSLDGNKLTLSPGAVPGPIGKNKVVWEVVKATDDALILKTDKGKSEESKKAPKE